MGEDEKKWASKVGLVGLFQLQWITPRHDLLVEFFNTYQIKEDTIYARLIEKNVVIDKISFTYVFKIPNTGWKKQRHIDKQTSKVIQQRIVLQRTYVNVEQWSVNQMKNPYNVWCPTII